MATALIALGLILDLYSVVMIVMVRRRHKQWASPIIAIPFLIVGAGVLLHPMSTSTSLLVLAAAACVHVLCAFIIPRWILPRLL